MLVSSIMDKNVITVAPDDSVRHASKLLLRYNIGSVPVCSEGRKLRGMVTDRDIALRCIATGADPDNTPVKEIMTRSIVSVSPDDNVHDAAKQMAEQQVRRLPVVSGGRLAGMLSLCDIARNRPNVTEIGAVLCEISSGIRRK